MDLSNANCHAVKAFPRARQGFVSAEAAIALFESPAIMLPSNVTEPVQIISRQRTASACNLMGSR